MRTGSVRQRVGWTAWVCLALAAGVTAPAGVQASALPGDPVMGGVDGTVTTAAGRAVAGARVELVEAPDLAGTTGADGRFRLPNVPAGRYRLRAELDGFGRTERTVEVHAGATAPLKQVPGFSLFRRTSSLVSHPTTQGVSLRGVGASGASRTLVLLDGVPQNDAFGNWVYWDTVPQLQIESIEVAPSGLSDLYGSSAMAGVISVTTRRPQPRTASLQAGNWRLEYAPSPKLTLYQDGRLFAEDRENGTPLQTNATRETMLGGGLRAATDGASVWQANAYAHFSSFDSSFSSVAADRASETLGLAQEVDYDDVGGNLQWTRQLGRSHQLSAGGDLRFIQADNREDVFIASGANVRDRLIPAQQLYSGAYIQDVIAAGPRVVLTLGLRVAFAWQGEKQDKYDIYLKEIGNPVAASHDGSPRQRRSQLVARWPGDRVHPLPERTPH